MSWATYGAGYSFTIFVDTNGFKGPNQFGKDRFDLSPRASDGSGTVGIPVKILPDNDNNYYACLYNKCATQNNYYATSWLQN